MKLKDIIQKICCFYVNDWHLIIMLLPYITNKIDENISVYMRCENEIEMKEKIETLLCKMGNKNKSREINLKWNNSVEEETEDQKDKIFIVSGDDEYIRNKNKVIEEYYINKNCGKIKIINCYEINEDCKLKSIVRENGYTKVLNTKGESYIEDAEDVN